MKSIETPVASQPDSGEMAVCKFADVKNGRNRSKNYASKNELRNAKRVCKIFKKVVRKHPKTNQRKEHNPAKKITTEELEVHKPQVEETDEIHREYEGRSSNSACG